MSLTHKPPLRFRPPPWAWAGLIPALALLLTLGSWQLRRGMEKIELQQKLDAAQTLAPTPLAAGAAPPPAFGALHASAAGRYDGAHQLLLDNESHEGRPGYHVLTPLRLADGAIVVVDRGWVPQGAQRKAGVSIDIDDSSRELSGLWRRPVQPGLRLATDNCAAGEWPRVVQYPEVGDLRCLYGESVLPGVLLLAPDATDGYVRDWRVSTGFPPQRHYAYAAQWYAFAATLLFLFIKLNLRRSAS